MTLLHRDPNFNATISIGFEMMNILCIGPI
jgi:hypothetical protein